MTGENRSVEAVLLVSAIVLLAVGGMLYLAGWRDGANVVWAVTTTAGLVAATWRVIAAARQGRLRSMSWPCWRSPGR